MSSRSQDDNVFKALAHPRRREMLDLLKDAPKTTGMLCEAFSDVDRCTVMLHLKVLEEADLIVARREGRERWNHLNALPIKQIHDRWISQYAGHALSIIDRLKSDLEG
ncbi:MULTISPECIES: helix-turn-helix domain-containing protein [unclassified Mesorhizobium]|uniref:ArsR/SmtB family transcription factor n=1 Tax=unclassified Mesorhizobium TaxID=325217 RepID=UPI00112C9721|nr:MULTISPECIES: helix-turn-helix domain-containing protein [unclassified Mesorhizobium]MBZ9806481.1 helix-turn-helix domain-containing protein [Mesorhizobium sp. ESP-6-2]MBZ9855496.1 helix-turn-helix domain-containing protein [Mesorhizobium sp. CA13]MBZ9870771.1 helix-turn-helix domain-containing protein [Mesorhizobium sp. BR1-1-9]MBZ9939673.1 helix-turn-helix domain-containing protein [Mesorhizobium sp. BR1-1-13]MBZ9966785.1 helix-turn-helix domain-containing protein [Mesorhizobium sp. BR1-1